MCVYFTMITILEGAVTAELVYKLGYWMKPRQWSFFFPQGQEKLIMVD